MKMKLSFAMHAFVMTNVILNSVADQSSGSNTSRIEGDRIGETHFNDEQPQSFVRRNARSLSSYYTDSLVDSMETAYDEYSQAWRMLGFYIDCGDDDDVVVNNARRYRRLDEADANDNVDEENAGDDGAAADGNVADDAAAAEGGCNRYLLWAAYVDLEYEGNGLSEYQIYNPHAKKWDKTMCDTTGNTVERCAKMDCHLPNTRYKLLGFFKEQYPLEFIQVLSNHQGTCSWASDGITALQTELQWLPQTCTLSTTRITPDDTTQKPFALYFDLAPKYGGKFDVGLYTDTKCSVPYIIGSKNKNYATSASAVLNSFYGYEIDATTSTSSINSLLDDFKVCQPCRTYNLASAAAVDNADADVEGEDQAVEQQSAVANEYKFVCNDAAGYAGVNMCSMFASTTTIEKASFQDVTHASGQTTILLTNSSADLVPTWWEEWGFFLISALVFVLGVLCFCAVAVKRKRSQPPPSRWKSMTSSDKGQPLIQ